MRSTVSSLLAVALTLSLASTAAADTFGGFGGREDGYLVGRDRICTPLEVTAGKATGTPACVKASTDEVAQLSVKTPKAVRGKDASHSAEARSRTLTITDRDREAVVVTWEAPDPISKVDNLYLSTYARLAAVEYTVRRGGRDVTEVVVFDLRGAGGATAKVHDAPKAPKPDDAAKVAAPAATPALKKALKAARTASKGKPAKALRAWQKVQAIDPESSEAHHGVATAQARAKKKDLAYAALEALAASSRADAIEFLVLARFDKAFAGMRAEARFRTAVGLDQAAGTFYERLMGNGGTWEQAGTSCDTPGVKLTLNRDRSFKLVISSVCSGERYQDVFKGTWQDKDPALTLILPNKGRDNEEFACLVEKDGDEDALRCQLDDDLNFVVRPVRR